MGYCAVLAEKPEMARKIASALGARVSARQPTPIAFDGGEVVCTIGHFLELAAPEAYDPRWQAWTLATLPLIPRKWRLVPREGMHAALRALIARLCAPRVTEIVLATDAGPEGELIAREVLEACAGRHRGKKITRLWASATSARELRRAYEQRQPEERTRTLLHAAKVRQRQDWLWGLNATRAMTLRARAPGTRGVISIGRVQTPTLALIVARERERRAFVPVDHWWLRAQVHPEALDDAQANRFELAHRPDPHLTDTGEAKTLAERARGQSASLQVNKERRRRAPQAPYNLSALQHQMARTSGWSAEHTLSVAQSLYETRSAITYPRTAARAMLASEWPEITRAFERVRRLLPAIDAAARAAHEPVPVRRAKVINDKAMEGHDHPAIVPDPDAGSASHPREWTSDERALFKTIANRFAAQMLPDWTFDHTTVRAEAAGVTWKATGIDTVHEGWHAVDSLASGAKDDEHQALPALADPTQIRFAEVEPVATRTRPPPRYIDGELPQTMARAGIGTEATRASMGRILRKRGYTTTEQNGKRVETVPTALGEALVERVRETVPSLAETETTAQLEQMLTDIRSGERDPREVMTHVENEVGNAIERMKTQPIPTLPAAPAPQGAAPRPGTRKKRAPSRRKSP